MIMKNTLILCLAFTLVNGCAFGQMQLGPHKWSATIKVIDEDDHPIANVNVSVNYSTDVPEDSGEKTYGEIKGVTDTNGMFSASHTDKSWTIGATAEKIGYYTTHIGRELKVPGQSDEKTVEESRNPKLVLVLKKIGKPIPMYAKQIASLKVPELNKAIGYDLMVGDWIAPYGKGVSSDIVFTQTNTNADSGYILLVDFPKPGDGIQEFIVPDAEKGSGLRSVHEAPVDGYQPEIAQTKMTDQNRNFYFRVRTILDESGNVKSARYGKIYGDLAQFGYYLNPTSNSRNIEFDPKQNLLGSLKSTEQVTAP